MPRARVALICMTLACPLLVPAAPVEAKSATSVMIRQINKFRRAHGVRPMRASSSLNRSARRWSRRQMRSGYYGHGRRVYASRRFRWRGEVIMKHGSRWPRVMYTLRAWKRSSGHRRILLSRTFRWVGGGYSTGRFRGRRATIWTVQVGRK